MNLADCFLLRSDLVNIDVKGTTLRVRLTAQLLVQHSPHFNGARRVQSVSMRFLNESKSTGIPIGIQTSIQRVVLVVTLLLLNV
jgi:hypothetical protein